MFNYYSYKGRYLFSSENYDFPRAPEAEIKKNEDRLYFLCRDKPLKSRRNFLIKHPDIIFHNNKGIELLLLDSNEDPGTIPPWLLKKIQGGMVISLNMDYPSWEDALISDIPDRWKINILALGDVGSTLLIGLRLLGGHYIDRIGIYDMNPNNLKRWNHEINQIVEPSGDKTFPPIVSLNREDLFDCDLFLFCASGGVPPVESGVKDPRMVQFSSNSDIIKGYAKMARDRKYRGIFGVISDPVDLLCKVAFIESNKNHNNEFDFRGLASNQIIGYGLGVMNARASFYAKQSKSTIHYLNEGRVFGPHGKGLIVADSIINYDPEISSYLTEKTLNANMEIRELGFKPYVAPSLSSGALSVIATIKGEWFYGSNYIGDAYMGSRCRLSTGHIEIEQLDLPMDLVKEIEKSYQELNRFFRG